MEKFKKNFFIHSVLFRKGQSLMELLVAIGLTSILLPALIIGLWSSREGTVQQERRSQAQAVLKETYEVVKNVKNQENGWEDIAAITNLGPYHPFQSPSYEWELQSGYEDMVSSGFRRQIVVTNVQRNPAGNGSIVEFGGTEDPSTKKVEITVSWEKPYTSSITSRYYVSRTDNLTFTHTIVSDFTNGIFSNTVGTNTTGGEVTLKSGGISGDWCTPNAYVVEDLNITADQNNAKRMAVPSDGNVYMVGDTQFTKINVTNTDPPVASVVYDNPAFRAEDIEIVGNYAFIARNDTSKELAVIDLTPGPSQYTEVASYNPPATRGAMGISVVDGKGYLTAGQHLFVFDAGLPNPAGILSGIGSFPVITDLGDWLTRVEVLGNYAYVGVAGDNSKQMVIMDVSNPGAMIKRGATDVNNSDAVEIVVRADGNRVYLGTSTSTSYNEFFIINTENKLVTPLPVKDSYEANTLIKGFFIMDGRALIAGGTDGGIDYQVVNLEDENNIFNCAQIDFPSAYGKAIGGRKEADGQAYSYLVTTDFAADFKVILGGTGGGGGGGTYSSSGTFQSEPFYIPAPTTDIAFNRFSATIDQPASTDITIDVGVAADNGSNCATVSYVYQTPLDYNENAGTATGIIPLMTSGGYKNPGRCYRYRVNFSTTNTSITPRLLDITTNYSP